MKRLILTVLILFCCFSSESGAQGSDSLSLDLFSLYENASDQEGMFYLPQVKKSGFMAGSKMVNERRLQTATKTSNYKAIIQSASNLAWMELEQENYEKALTYFDAAIQAHVSSGEPKSGALLYLQKGFVQYRSLDYEGALNSFNTALSNLQKFESEQNII